MKHSEPLIIDQASCSNCGLCINVCPFGNLKQSGGLVSYSGDKCLSCGHCAAACPNDAISIADIEPSESVYKTFTIDSRWLQHGDYNTAGLVRLMASRRSCRNFDPRAVDREILEDLVKIGITAPSGTNSQSWTFTILPTRKAVVSFAGYVSLFFRKLNAMAEKRVLRTALKIAGKSELDAYYRDYYQLVKKALDEWENNGKDRLFHGAVSAIIVGSAPGASCPAEDALLATQNILLAAHSIGLGSCLIGFAVSAIKEAPAIKASIGIPMDESVHAVVALGYPDEAYETVAGRKKPEMRYYEG
ncbi:MAG TPA: nitroreductase family protein [Dissulfurispiraceae bacterium]|nr:nitroreductase family protein [Dissulfurispiraceae bacterium]